MRLLIIAILLGFPALEGIVLYRLGQGHTLWVVAWLLLSATLGVALIKEARLALLARLAAEFSQGRFSLAALIDSGRTVLAGLLLIFPGIISDLLALLVLFLPLNRESAAAVKSQRGVFEGEFRRES
jgi:UPF0716 protein FxsA